MNKEYKLQVVTFKNINFSQVIGPKAGQVKLNVKHGINFNKSTDNKSLRCILNSTVETDDNMLKLELVTVGIFSLTENFEENEEIYQQMVNLVYPYARNEISLISSSSGTLPILLPFEAPIFKMENKDSTIFA